MGIPDFWNKNTGEDCTCKFILDLRGLKKQIIDG